MSLIDVAVSRVYKYVSVSYGRKAGRSAAQRTTRSVISYYTTSCRIYGAVAATARLCHRLTDDSCSDIVSLIPYISRHPAAISRNLLPVYAPRKGYS